MNVSFNNNTYQNSHTTTQHHHHQLIIYHFNIRSLSKNIDNLKSLLSADQHNPDIIILSKTWLSVDHTKSKLSHIEIDGYTFISKPRHWGRGGGVGMYIKSSINFSTCIKFSTNLLDRFEHIVVKIKGKNSQSNCIISGLYRPPTFDSNMWLNSFEQLYRNILADKCNNVVFAGDLNYNLLDAANSHTINNTIGILNLYQPITSATRITNTTKALLDIFLVANKCFILKSNTLADKPLTDHEGIYLALKTKAQIMPPIIKTVRQDKTLNPKRFLHDLSEQPFHQIYESCNPNSMLSKLNSYILTVLNKHAPQKQIKISKPPAPWIDDAIKKLITKRNALYRKSKRTNIPDDILNHALIHKTVKRSIYLAKQNFINKCLTKPNLKKVWNVINRLLKPSCRPITHDINKLNDHFINTSERTTGKTPQPTLIPDSPNGTFAFHHTTCEQVLRILNKLKTDCATGPDLIPAKYIKLSADIIAPHITNIINTCIQQNIFPDVWKTSRVSPIPKTDSPDNMNDYRPISVLPTLSKIFEKVLIEQIITHIDSNNVYPTTLSGCRQGHSTSTALLHIRDTCIKALKSNEITILGLVDFSKAFDTLNYSTLLQTLSTNNFSNSAINLLHSYLTNRKQFIQHSNKTSNLSKIVSGVPQGSLLGPILFNLYVITMNHKATATDATVINYVDDFQLLHHDKPTNIANLTDKIRLSIETLKTEADYLDLTFNSNKTKYILLSTNQTSKRYNLTTEIPEINIDGTKISRTTCQKNLGVHFDQHLRFDTHHKQTLRSAYATIHSLNSLKHTLCTKVKLQLIDSLIFSKLTYANVVTFPTTKTWLSKYNKVFKTALSFAFNKYISTSDLPSINLLNITSRWKMSLLLLTHKSLYSPQFPSYLKLSLQTNQSHCLRSSSAPLIQLPKVKDDTFADHASTLFNSLPANIRSIQGQSQFHLFKAQVKSYLLTHQYLC
jgi:hypothetical protein